ncbi:unnamed protein product [marine sediment metagenome]|uniref:Uncharacterized protein n=1 Tax=marine sediment metagenome TaxID=412755 RepID=X0ZGN6_9ZZZZ
MSEDRLVLNTKKSLYEPIEIVIDEQVYQCVKATRTVLADIEKLDDKAAKNEDEALYKIVQILFNVDQKILEKLDKREVQDIYTFSKKKFLEIEKQRVEIITDSFSKIFPGQAVVKKIPPSGKRPGSKH